MKERPILFSGSMVNAILDEHKTQTRRIIKPHPIPDRHMAGKLEWNPRRLHYTEANTLWDPLVNAFKDFIYNGHCTYGKKGDRLWVKETFSPHPEFQHETIYRADRGGDFQGAAQDDFKWKPSIFMPRKRSRITMEIISIRVERLQDISEADALAEGIQGFEYKESCGTRMLYGVSADQPEHGSTAKFGYEILWESINGAGSWKANPWVWVIEFKRL